MAAQVDKLCEVGVGWAMMTEWSLRGLPRSLKSVCGQQVSPLLLSRRTPVCHCPVCTPKAQAHPRMAANGFCSGLSGFAMILS